jgi:hypothetical protein
LEGEGMQSHLSSPWNYAVAFLETRYGEALLATGSCFFWSFDNRTFLITNWHNLAGRNPLTYQPMSEMAAIPDRIIFGAYKRISENDSHGFFEMKYVPVEIKLCDNNLSNPQWYEHPELGERLMSQLLT